MDNIDGILYNKVNQTKFQRFINASWKWNTCPNHLSAVRYVTEVIGYGLIRKFKMAAGIRIGV